MTIIDALEKYEIKYSKIKIEKAISIFKVGEMNVLFWINDGNAFEMKRRWFELLAKECLSYALILYDKTNKKYYFIKLPNNNNWVSGSFNNCDKSELFLGKQVLNYPSTINSILKDLKSKSN